MEKTYYREKTSDVNVNICDITFINGSKEYHSTAG